MAYDIFTPTYNAAAAPVISLYADAAKAGAQVGTMIPTQTTAAIQGAMQGLDWGADFTKKTQENEIRQNQIEQLPVTNRLEQAQAQNAQTVAEINALKLEQAQKLQQIDLEMAKTKAQADKAKFDNEVYTYETKKRIQDTLNGGDPSSITKDPNAMSMIFSDSKYANGVLAALKGKNALTPEQAEEWTKNIDALRSQENAHEEAMAKEKARAKMIGDLDKLETAVNDSPDLTTALGALGYKGAHELWREDVQIVPSGVKTYKKDAKTGNETNEVDTSVPDAYDRADPKGGYEIIVNGKRSPVKITTEKSAASLLKYLNSSKEAYGIQPSARPSQPTTAPAPEAAQEKSWWQRMWGDSTPAAPAKSMNQISAILENAGINSDRAAIFVNNVLQNGSAEQAVHSGKSIIEKTAPELALEQMAILKSGNVEAKQQLRAWAEENNVTLSTEGLTKYYTEQLSNVVKQAYSELGALSREQKAAMVRQDNAKSAARGLLKGKRPEQVQATVASAAGKQPSSVPDFFYDPTIKGTPDMIADLDAKVEKLAQDYSLSPKTATSIKNTAVRVDENEYLKDQPAYVKAVAAVESAGREGAVSPTGVQGLMQVTKSVAAMYGLNRNIPEQNVQAGAMYLDDLIKMFGGAKALAYAAYNTGPGVIKYAQKLAGGSTDWAEVKPHLMAALIKYQGAIGVSPAQKIKEVINYPERVALYEQLYGNSVV